MREDNKGFTLVELLVVISIIGIISLISIPLVRNVQNKNSNSKYDQYLQTLIQSAKLYVDTYDVDLFGQCVNADDEECKKKITFAQLKDKSLLKDIQIDGITCNTPETYVIVTKNGNKYKYSGHLGCGSIRDDGSVNINVRLPKSSSINGDDDSNRIKVIVDPIYADSIRAKRRNIYISLSSETGISDDIRIKYCFAEDTSSTNIQCNDQLSFSSIPSASSQNESLKNGPVVIDANLIKTPANYTGTLYLLLKVENLKDLSGDNWTDSDSSFLFTGPYVVDNIPPTFDDNFIVSDSDYYNTLKPAITAQASDNITLNPSYLRMCYSVDEDTCGKTVSDFTNYTKYKTYYKLPSYVSSAYNGSEHVIYLTIVDRANNYTTKTVNYKVAKRYKATYRDNGGSGCSNVVSDVRFNSDNNSEGYTWNDLCVPSREEYNFVGWNTKSDGTGKWIKDGDVATSTVVLYAQWENGTYTISYDIDLPGARKSYQTTDDDYQIPNPIRYGYNFIGWTGSNGDTPQTNVIIPKGSRGNKSYFANFSPKEYTITYIYNRGSVPNDTQSCTFGDECHLIKSKISNCFNGWWTSPTNGTEYGATTTILGNTNIYAHWKC